MVMRVRVGVEDLSQVMYVCEDIDLWYEHERQGRELAARGGHVTREVPWVVHAMAEDVSFMTEAVRGVAPDVLEVLMNISRSLSDIAKFLDGAVCVYDMSEPCRNVFGFEPWVPAALERLERYVLKLTGRRCLWGWGKVPPSSYTIALLVNDATSCFHRVIEWAAKYLCPSIRLSSRVAAVKGFSPTLAEYALWWDHAVSILDDMDLYASEDAPALGAIVKPDEVEFRVGSSPGHATHCEKKPVGVRCTYYDTDFDVNLAMVVLAHSHGVEVEDADLHDHVTFFVYWEKAQRFFAGILPFSTSMDFRLKNPDDWWGPDYAVKAMEGLPYVRWLGKEDIAKARQWLRHELYGEPPPRECTNPEGEPYYPNCPDGVKVAIESALCIWTWREKIKPSLEPKKPEIRRKVMEATRKE